ncbi:5-oxoprolinase subunit PxpB [Falsibacillus albus]|uniref:5-oxoprolinase subunit PxpB n=1 Tax=Falsibacillus albus TaxID=2478915 RepID=UPI00131449DC|nr:5-oxoprolinase subunit PxpB [Falsibacillus albus]
MASFYYIAPLGDQAMIVSFTNEISNEINRLVHWAAEQIIDAQIPAITEVVPAFCTLTIHYNPLKVDGEYPFEIVRTKVSDALTDDPSQLQLNKELIKIPVCYDLKWGKDLEEVAKYNNLSVDEVVKRHCQKKYLVYFLGFTPGFPFMGEVDPKIAMPRKNTPRTSIPKGSVGIAGIQTGIYPVSSPGGWQIIGRTPVDLFNPNNETPALLKPGYQVQFFPISENEFINWGED